jgi:hypothetical protein
MTKLIIAALFTCLAGSAFAGVVTTITGSCSVFDASKQLIHAATYPDNCSSYGVMANVGYNPGTSSGGGGQLIPGSRIAMDDGFRIGLASTDQSGYSYTGFFSMNSTIDNWYVMPGSGVLTGYYSQTFDSFSLAGIISVQFPIVSTVNLGGGHVTGGGTPNTEFVIPFFAGVPFEIKVTDFIDANYKGFLSGQGASDFTMEMGFNLYVSDVQFAAAPAPEPATWPLLLCGLAAIFRYGRRTTGTSPR